MAGPANRLTGGGNGLFPDASDPLTAQAPTLADAWQHNAQVYQDWVEAQRQDGIAKGLIDPRTGELTEVGQSQQALQFALGFSSGGLAAAEAPLIGSAMVSRLRTSYKPPVVSPRAFEADYPGGAPVDGSGNLTQTVDGQPITARYVVGRRALQQPDVALTPPGINAISEGLLGATPTPVVARSRFIGRDAGRLTTGADPTTGDPAFNLVFDKNLPSGVRDDTIAHEVAHGINYLAGTIPQDGIKRELGQVYHTLNSPQPMSAGLSTPQNLYGYINAQAPGELMAESIRAYMQDPNYLKTAAPGVAARVRDYVNANPRLRDWIQFNSLAGLTAGGVAASDPGQQADPPQ